MRENSHSHFKPYTSSVHCLHPSNSLRKSRCVVLIQSDLQAWVLTACSSTLARCTLAHVESNGSIVLYLDISVGLVRQLAAVTLTSEIIVPSSFKP